MKKKSVTNLVTEEYLDVKLALFRDEIIGEVKDMFTESNSKLYSRIDPILSEIENSRIDRELTTEKLEDHEKRIKKLERN